MRIKAIHMVKYTPGDQALSRHKMAINGDCECKGKHILLEKTHIMALNLFTRRKSAYFFSDTDWVQDPSKNSYSLRISLGKSKITSQKKVYLYKLQGTRYIFMNAGFETVIDNEILYTAQFPFSGKISIK